MREARQGKSSSFDICNKQFSTKFLFLLDFLHNNFSCDVNIVCTYKVSVMINFFVKKSFLFAFCAAFLAFAQIQEDEKKIKFDYLVGTFHRADTTDDDRWMISAAAIKSVQ